MGRNKQVSDEAVLAAARAVFVEQGFGASTREIARRAGISEAVLYQRHKTKLDLFIASMIPPPLELAGAASGKSFAGDLSAMAIEIMRYFRRAMPVLLQLVTHPSFNLAEHSEHMSRMPLHNAGGALAARLQQCAAAGTITANQQRIHIATLTLIATLHSLALFERIGVHGSFPDDAVRNIVGLIVAGLAPQKETSHEDQGTSQP